jgi:hypothetical protein
MSIVTVGRDAGLAREQNRRTKRTSLYSVTRWLRHLVRSK